MKIYFEDGELRDNINRRLHFRPDIDYGIEPLDASWGVSVVRNSINRFNPDCIVYTNSLIPFDNKYAWNEELGVPEIYLFVCRPDNHCEWVRIDNLTDRELRESHNLMKLYLAGEFDK